MRPRAFLAPAMALATALAGCDPEKPSGGAADAGPADAAAEAASPGAAAPAQTAAAPGSAGAGRAPGAGAAEHLQLLKMTLTSAVKDKEPADKLEVASAGERVYAHLSLRNRTEEMRQVEVMFMVNGSTRSHVVLDVEESWQWRTWAYATLREGDSGEITVIATEIDGPELRRVTLPIRKGRGK